MNISSRYSRSFILAALLHLALLIGLLFTWIFSTHEDILPGSQVQIMHAVTLNASQMKALTDSAHYSRPPQIQHKKLPPSHQPEKQLEKPMPVSKPLLKTIPKPHEQTPPRYQKDLIPIEKTTVKKIIETAPKVEHTKVKMHKSEVEKQKSKILNYPPPKKASRDINKAKAELAKQVAKELAEQDRKNELRDLLKQEDHLDRNLDHHSSKSSEKTSEHVTNEQGTDSGKPTIDAALMEKYKALIREAISQHWNIPQGTNNNLTCSLLITLAPGGSVLGVQVLHSSGIDALDRSAIQAVYQASPLPIPSNADLFEQFREIHLDVTPKNISNI